jgi:hypothetical protein
MPKEFCLTCGTEEGDETEAAEAAAAETAKDTKYSPFDF